jgi:uncharacterized protein YndB with AHSA1/START domain
MKSIYTATASIEVKATDESVWKALVDPALIKQYLFGTEAVSDWKQGSAIFYRGVWEGKPYEDKGRILEVVPPKRFKSTYWSAFSGLPDRPENYNTVTYTLERGDGGTFLTVIQDNIPTQEAADHSTVNWSTVLKAIKALLEKPVA